MKLVSFHKMSSPLLKYFQEEMYHILQILVSENSPKYSGIIYCNSTQVPHHSDFFIYDLKH